MKDVHRLFVFISFFVDIGVKAKKREAKHHAPHRRQVEKLVHHNGRKYRKCAKSNDDFAAFFDAYFRLCRRVKVRTTLRHDAR